MTRSINEQQAMNHMDYYPILLDLRGKKCIVIGAGKVAQRKVHSLLLAQARVYVISPSLAAGLRRLSKTGKIFWIKSEYKKSLLTGALVVIAATNNKRVNLRISQDAGRTNLLVNIVDSPKQSSFIAPAVIRSKGLITCVSTSGQVPYLARRIKQDIKKTIIPRYSGLLDSLELTRKQLKENCHSIKKRKAILASILRKALADAV